MNTTEMHIPSNRVSDIERYFHSELDALYGDGEVKMFIRLLFEAFLGWSRAKLLTHRSDTVNQSDLLRFHWAAEDLKRFRPIQHIIGWTEFCGCRIEVDRNTLIPRPETEEIVTRAIGLLAAKPPHRILDLCTGSGCIAIALAKQWPEAEVWAVDISENALTVAKRNAQTNNVNVSFLQADILRSPFSVPRSPFSLIISNPPYVMEREKRDMQRNVLDWEPPQALFVPDSDPLLFYRTIADIAADRLNAGGMLLLEINGQMGDATLQMLSAKGFAGEIHKDFQGKDRCITATRR